MQEHIAFLHDKLWQYPSLQPMSSQHPISTAHTLSIHHLCSPFPYSSPSEQLRPTPYTTFTERAKTVSYMPSSDNTHFYSRVHVHSIHHLFGPSSVRSSLSCWCPVRIPPLLLIAKLMTNQYMYHLILAYPYSDCSVNKVSVTQLDWYSHLHWTQFLFHPGSYI